MDKAILTVLLIVISTVMAMLLFNTIYPALVDSSDAMASYGRASSDRMKTRVEVVHAIYDADNQRIIAWVKNIGTTRIAPIDSSDIFAGQEGNFIRKSLGPEWTYTVEDGGEWTPTKTVRFQIEGVTLSPTLRYYFKVVIPGGKSAETIFG